MRASSTRKAQRLQGRVSRTVRQRVGLLHEVPDLVEYPSVIAGTFALEFLELPEEVLTTTLIHHQHYFPVEGEDGKLKNAFLAVINTEPDNERTIARNAERVVTARLRDARFFWEADRKIALESRIDRLGTLLFHKKLGTYKEKAERDREAGARGSPTRRWARPTRRRSGRARRRGWRKPISRPTWSASSPSCRARWAASMRAPRGSPKKCGRRSTSTTCRSVSRPTRRRPRAQLGKAAVTWAAVSLADKLDTIVGLFAAGEKPTGSRDPYGLRRAAQGVIKILADLPGLGIDPERVRSGFDLRASRRFGSCSRSMASADALATALRCELLLGASAHLFEQRGFKSAEIQGRGWSPVCVVQHRPRVKAA